MSIQILNFKHDDNHFYVGHSLNKNDNWLTFQTIDNNGYLGSIHILKKDKININTLLQERKFYEYLENNNKIIDPFNLYYKNKQIRNLQWYSLSDLFIQLKTVSPIISIESTSGITYTGKISNIHSTYLYLNECNTNYELNEFPLKIDYKKIAAISPNSVENQFLSNWLSLNTYSVNHSLVELHFNYQDDQRFNNFYIGKIIKEDQNQLLFESLNDLGQLDGILSINKRHVTHISHQSSDLAYYDYLMHHHIQNDTFNPRKLNTNYKLLSSKDFMQTNPLIAIDNTKFDNTNIGIVKEINKNYFLLQNIDEYQISDNIQKIFFNDLAAIEITSNEQVLLREYFSL